jgi:hypothetical protein
VNNPVQAVFLLLFGLPILIRLVGLIFFGAVTVTTLIPLLNPDRARIENALTVDDIAFGGNPKQLRETLTRLRSITANEGDARAYNRSLAVAIVNVSADRSPKKPIEIDLANAHDGAILVIANRPVVWSTVGVSPKHRAKIGFEGSAVFDVVNAPRGILAGFRVGGFGAANVTNPLDVHRNRSPKDLARFCESIRSWSNHFQVSTGTIKVWRIEDPDRISVYGDSLSVDGGTEPKPEFISDICRSKIHF